MIVTIDGPAGAGKSSVARALARRLGFRFLDTGAMYRAVAWAAIERKVSLEDETALGELAELLSFEMKDNVIKVDGRDVSNDIRSIVVTSATRHPAGNQRVRKRLVRLQREIASGYDVVTEGRDQGTVAFPYADCKIFLTATPKERARRRWLDMLARGEKATLDEILAQQEQRDFEDRNRPVGALVPADDAIEVFTDGQSPDEVIDRLEELVLAKRG